MVRHSLWHALEGFYPNRIRVIPKRQRFPSQRPRRYPDMEIATRRELTMARDLPATPYPRPAHKCQNVLTRLASQGKRSNEKALLLAGAPPAPVTPL